MCGIAGFAAQKPLERQHVKVELKRMVGALHHRGPDDRDLWFDQHAALGHTRLAIIDLSPLGRQPMGSEDRDVQIVFNGEIYNHRVLRTELIAAGHRFISRTDTEVLIHGYQEWGLEGLLQRLEGMFAFAIWDANRKCLWLARDHFGIKPLYHAFRDGRLSFASELKALLAETQCVPPLDREGLLLGFLHVGVPAPKTVYAGYEQLPPGCWLRFDVATGAIAQQCYWQWTIEPQIDDPRQAQRTLWDAIVASVDRHLAADVPVGVFLSGGLDSSLVAAACAELGRKPTCLTIAVGDREHDESPFAALACRQFGFEHWVAPMGADEAMAFNPLLPVMFDEPFGSSAALSAAFVNKLASTRFKVMLSGDGGDEMFGGYAWYAHWTSRYGSPHLRRRLSWFQQLRQWLARPAEADRDPVLGYARLLGGYLPSQLASMFDPGLLSQYPHIAAGTGVYARIDAPDLSDFDRLQTIDTRLFLPTECLTKMDRTSMAYGLEVRVPLLDRTVADVARRIHQNVRNPNGRLKGLLKEIAASRLPAKLLTKRKTGFSTPINRWFPARAMRNQIERALAESRWWAGILHPEAAAAAGRLKGRPLWRFWHLCRFVHNHAQLEAGAAVAAALTLDWRAAG